MRPPQGCANSIPVPRSTEFHLPYGWYRGSALSAGCLESPQCYGANKNVGRVMDFRERHPPGSAERVHTLSKSFGEYGTNGGGRKLKNDTRGDDMNGGWSPFRCDQRVDS